MSRLEDKRTWIAGGAAVALLIGAAAWYMLISPKLASATDINKQAAATEQQNTVLQAKLRTLQAKSLKIRAFTASLRAALLALPYDSGLPAFTRQLSARAKANSVSLSSITVGSVTAVTAATTPTTSTDTGSVAPTPTTTSTDGATAAPVAVNPAGSLYSVQVTIVSDGTLARQIDFLSDIRTAGPRRVLLTSTQISPGTGAGASIDSRAGFTTQLTVFSAPQTPGQIAQLKKLLRGKLGP